MLPHPIEVLPVYLRLLLPNQLLLLVLNLMLDIQQLNSTFSFNFKLYFQFICKLEIGNIQSPLFKITLRLILAPHYKPTAVINK